MCFLDGNEGVEFRSSSLLLDLIINTFSHLFAGVLNEDGSINNEESIARLAEISVNYAKEGQYHVNLHCLALLRSMDFSISLIQLSQDGPLFILRGYSASSGSTLENAMTEKY